MDPIVTTAQVARCCSTHRDWADLARHLLADFADVPTRSIIDELARARRAGDFFELEGADALDCAELIVRHRVLSATGHAPTAAPPTRVAPVAGIAQVA